MRTGKSNKPSLAERLDKLSLPAGSSYDRETAWEKLHDRLYGKKKNRKKAMFIWLISVPVAASLFYFLFMTGGDKIENGKPKSTINSGGGITKSPDKSSKEMLVVETQPEIQSADKNRAQRLPLIQKIDKRENSIQQPGNETATIDTQTPLSFLPVKDSASSTTAIAAVQTPSKKLRVVHNNELSDSPSAIPNDQGNTVASTGPARFFPGLRRPPSNNPEEINDDTIRKLKSKRSILPFSSFVSQKE